MLTGASMAARVAVEECFKWANQRQVFGKRLIDQPVIRFKLAKMVGKSRCRCDRLSINSFINTDCIRRKCS